MNTPKACIRLQFNRDFTLANAAAMVDYFAELGISHIYSSPLFKARPGSSHGYDVVSTAEVNPDIGGEEGLGQLVNALGRRNIGLIVDFVPNHMAACATHNEWWRDVLRWGRGSRYASYFDIRWFALPSQQMLLPILGEPLSQSLSSGQLQLHFEAERGELSLQYHQQRLPLTPPSYAILLAQSEHPELRLLGEQFASLQAADHDMATELHSTLAMLAELPESNDALARLFASCATVQKSNEAVWQPLLQAQHYQLCDWRQANTRLNWRRFFDVNELAGLRVENGEVFEALHSTLFEFIERGWIQGLRLDHIDGLANPRHYCRRLRRRVNRLLGQHSHDEGDSNFPIYVEKILAQSESLPRNWKVNGTSGYDFINQLSLLQNSPEGEAPLRRLWQQYSSSQADFRREAYLARKQIVKQVLQSEYRHLWGLLATSAAQQADQPPWDDAALQRALLELLAHFPRYRSYALARPHSGEDKRAMQNALAAAKTTLSQREWPALSWLAHCLGGEDLSATPPGTYRRQRLQARVSFQQLTAPMTAKAIEDTACYRNSVLLNRCEVGCDPHYFSQPPEAFHRYCQQRARDFPSALSATTTHDCKRGEDSRARLAVISERPAWYQSKVQEWQQLSESLLASADAGPDAADRLQLYQSILGHWPLDLAPNSAALENFHQRLEQWQIKALREAKRRSSWLEPNINYETECRDFLQRLLLSTSGRPLRQHLAQAASTLAPAGALNSLAQTLLKITAPGVADIYQGSEYWDFSFVDPDNRQAVDFFQRQQSLKALARPADLLRDWHNGRIKQWLLQRGIKTRQRYSEVFNGSGYQPLIVTGQAASQVLAFCRRHHDDHFITVVPLQASALLGDQPLPHVPPCRWGDTRLQPPKELFGQRLTSALDGASFFVPREGLAVASLLAELPVNLLHSRC